MIKYKNIKYKNMKRNSVQLELMFGLVEIEFKFYILEFRRAPL